MKANVKLGPFQTQIIKCKTKPLLGESAHVMVTLLKAGKAQPDGGTASIPGPACFAHIYPAQDEQQQGVHSGE